MKVALVCTSNLTHDLSTWIHHHLHIVGINRIFLQIETDHVPEYIKNNPVILYFRNDAVSSLIDLQKRQTDFVNYCIRHFYESFDFILHIDDDELLTLNKKFINIQNYLASVKWKDEKYLRIQNYEAVLTYSTEDVDYFKTAIWFKDPMLDDFRGYKNGKSIGRLANGLFCNGCHTFLGKYKTMEKKDGVILHFDCMTFTKWHDKFKNMDINQVYFEFYRQSILMIQQKKNDMHALKQFWTYHASRCNHPINITFFYKIF
jgi:hypothetical protein